jgi:hypothetical protein
MSNVTVSSVAQLYTALKAAHSGDVILLAAGTYQNVNISNYSFSGGITIKSADANNHAVLTSLNAKNDSGINFSNLNFTAGNGATTSSFQFVNDSNISFNSISVTATAANSYSISPFVVRSSTNVSITNSEFSHVQTGITLLNNNGVTVSGNYVHDIGNDGLDSGGNSNIKISNNLFTGFNYTGDLHPDAMQFWTTGTTTSAQNITVTGNVVYASGGTQMQGVFMRDEVGTLPFQNVNVSNNVIIGALYNGISLQHVAGGTVSGNVVAALNSGGNATSWISVINGTGVAVDNNAASTLQMTNSILTSYTNNKVLPVYADAGQQVLSTYQSLIAKDLPGAFISPSQFASFVAQNNTHGATAATYATAPTLATSTGYAKETVFGSYAKDSFSFSASELSGTNILRPDAIVGFSSAQHDQINLSSLVATTASGTHPALNFIGTAAFDGHAGEVHYQVFNGNAYLSADLTGSGAASFMIELMNVTSIARGDLVL